MTKLVVHLVRWRWIMALCSLLIVALLSSGIRYISFAADYEVWFSPENPELRDFLSLQNDYNKSDNVVFLIAPKEGGVFTKETLASIEWLTREAWQIPFSTRVDSLSNFQYTHADNDLLIVEDLFENSETLTLDEITDISKVALKEPKLLHRIISSDSSVTAVNVTINLPKDSPEGSPTVTAFARNLVTQLQKSNPNLDIYLTGLVVMDNAFMEASMKDMSSLTLIMFVLIIFGLLVFLRSVSATVSILIIIVLSIVATMGFSGVIGVKLTNVSINAPTIVMTVVVANAVHLFVTLIQNMQLGMIKVDALTESLRVNIQPIVLATITTIIGFMSMHFSDVPPFHDLGNLVAFGVIVSLLFSMMLLPLLIMLMPIRVKPIENKDKIRGGMQCLSSFVIKNYSKLIWAVGTLSLLLFALIPTNTVNDNVWEYFDESIVFRTDTDYASDHLTGPYYLDFSLESNKPGGVNSPEFLSVVENFRQWLVEQKEVVHVNAITDTLMRLNMNMHADDPDWYQLPDNRQLTSQYMLLYEMSLPYGLDLNNQINIDKSATRIVVSLHNLSSNGMIDLHTRAEDWLHENANQYTYTSGSPMYMFSHISLRTVEQMISGVIFALTLISILIVFSLRSIRIGIISLIPNLIPPAMAFGVWALLIGEVGFSLAAGLGMTIGIIVDDTVHFLSKYLRARREQGLNAEEAVSYAFSRVGSALLITTFVLTMGFAVLMFSTFKSNFELGMMTALTICIALFVDFLLLPALLLKFDTRPHQ